MRPPGYWSLKSSICSTAASKSPPVCTTRNSGWGSWSLLGKSSAHDTEARMRKFAERRILASPSLSKMLFPTSIVAKDCRLRMVTLPAITQIDTRPAHRIRPSHIVICRRVKDPFFSRSFCVEIFWPLQSVGLSAFTGKVSWSNFEKLHACSRKAFINVRFEFLISLYTFGYRRAGQVLMDVIHNSNRRLAPVMVVRAIWPIADTDEQGRSDRRD